MDVPVISTSFSMPANRSQPPSGDKFGYGPISEDMAMPVTTEEGERERERGNAFTSGVPSSPRCSNSFVSVRLCYKFNLRIVKAMYELHSQDSTVNIATGHTLDDGVVGVLILLGP